MLCASLAERDVNGMVRAARAARAAGADIVEARLDGLSAPGVPVIGELRRRIGLPAIATLRPEWEGGSFGGGEDERSDLLATAAEKGFDYLDVELAMDGRRLSALLALCKRRGAGTIVSHHDFCGTPAAGRILRMIRRCSLAGDIGKVAYSCSSVRDAARIVEAARDARREGLAFIAIGMGEHGRLTRFLAPVMGSAMAYACLDRRRRTAGGQFEIGELVDMWGGPARRRTLSPRTALYGILGHPLGHSLSPAMHNAAFNELGMDAIYIPFDIENSQLGGAMEALEAAGLRGANVTIPHKQAIIAFLDRVDKRARQAGAVNTIVRRGARFLGSNTDTGGFIGALEAAGVRLKGARALVIGAGGAARAAVLGLLDEGAAVTVANRTRSRALGLRRALGAPQVKVIGLEDLPGAMRDADILVNCTPVGMKGFGPSIPVPARFLHGRMTVMDMVYNPEMTPLLEAAGKAGARTVSGIEMFTRQAMGSLAMWTGRAVPAAAAGKARAAITLRIRK